MENLQFIENNIKNKKMGGCKETDDPALQDQNGKKNTQTKPVKKKTTTQVSITLGEPDEVDAVKMLTLGAGESGKSTFLKHLEILYGGGVTEDQKASIRTTIRETIITDMKTLITALKHSNRTVDSALDTSINLVKEIPIAEDELTEDVADSIADLWGEQPIKELYSDIVNDVFPESKSKSSNDYTMCEFADYFFSNVERIADKNYEPTNEDILKMRKRTIGNSNFYFNFNTTSVTLIDVGGQKVERNKWQPLFDHIDYLLFIVSLSDFDQNLWEEKSIRRTQDSLMLFSQIAGADVFQDVPIFLIMNKVDAFEKKLKKFPDKFKEAYPGFTPTEPTQNNEINVNDAIEHIKRTFLRELGTRTKQGWIETYQLNAINSDSVKNVTQKIAHKVVSEHSAKQ
ncbi:hypothetical protein M9Y10_043266 [Tritrichomonas musculus]|uniref:Uncharacterized protein n=1 Tax=Tritrichomonas musculus TaxID=1915356 RepID=A0ABR2JZ67_9EUKA